MYGMRYSDNPERPFKFSTSLYGSDKLGPNCRGKRGAGVGIVHRRPIGSGDGLQTNLVATRSKHPWNGWLKWVRLPPPAPQRTLVQELLRELRRERSHGAGINASHAEDAFRVVELFPVQVQDRDLHRTSSLAFLAV